MEFEVSGGNIPGLKSDVSGFVWWSHCVGKWPLCACLCSSVRGKQYYQSHRAVGIFSEILEIC